jgi:histidinol-phosphate aminotransferase
MKYRETLERIKFHGAPRALELLRPPSGDNQLVNLALNESSFGHSPRVTEAIAAALPQLSRYPAVFPAALASKLAEKYGIAPNQLIFGDGIFELLSFVTQTFVDPGDEVVIPEPSFGWYTLSTWAAAGKVVSVPLRDDAIDLPAVAAAITARTKLVWLCNPHNPMGTLFRAPEFEAFVAGVPSDVALVVDEAYYEYADDPGFPDTVSLLGRHPNLIILRTFSKAYGLAGLRIGYGIARPGTIEQLNKVKSPPNVNLLAQVAALAALEDTAFTAAAVAGTTRRVRDYYRFCEEHRIGYIPTFANFIMVNVEGDGDQAVDEFLRQGIILRSGSEIGKPTWVRITIGTDGENQRVFAVLKTLVQRSRNAPT